MSPPWAGSSWRLTSSLLSCLLLYSPLPLSSSSGAGHQPILHPVPQGCQSSNLIKQIVLYIWSLLPLVCSVCSSPSKVLFFPLKTDQYFPNILVTCFITSHICPLIGGKRSSPFSLFAMWIFLEQPLPYIFPLLRNLNPQYPIDGVKTPKRQIKGQ